MSQGPAPRRGVCLLAMLLACARPTPPAAPTPAAPAPAPAPTPDPCADAPVPEDSAAALARAAVLQRCGASALPVYAALLARDPRPRWGHELAALALAEGAPERARALLAGDGPAARVGLALLDVAAFEASKAPADLERARASFQTALALTPDDPYALSVALRHYQALAAREPERLALAAQICRERLPADPAPPPPDGELRGAAQHAATCARGAVLSQEPGEARHRFALALALDPGDPATQLAWAAAELAAGNDRKAAELHAAALTAPAARDRYLAALGLGVARTRLHDRPGAEQAYRAAATALGLTASDPPDRYPPELQFNLGTLLADAPDPAPRAEARGLLRAYESRPDVDELRRLRCRQLLLELQE